MRNPPPDGRPDPDDLTTIPDLTLFALTEEILSAWRSDPNSGRAMLLAAMRAYPEQDDALLEWIAHDLHDDALDALLGAEQTPQQEQPQVKRVAEQRAPYGEEDIRERRETDGK